MGIGVGKFLNFYKLFLKEFKKVFFDSVKIITITIRSISILHQISWYKNGKFFLKTLQIIF